MYFSMEKNMADELSVGTGEKQIASTTAMCALDSKSDGITQRQNLCQVLEFGNQRKLIDFAWGSEMLSENTSLKSFKIKQHQESFPIPVSRPVEYRNPERDFRMQVALKAYLGNDDASKICDSTFEDFNLSYLVVQNLQLPEEMKVTAKCTKLVLYDGKTCFIHNSSSCWIEGKFDAAKIGVWKHLVFEEKGR
ncbi:hypothetical protein DAPPUDRAFT_337183 [Daphnia pulex]|uniref:Uncharacterized protein n=1 Tax=Daphnia pulex TaxID=6669 RepID=E9I160_DAPPU|nr:hypothetical protein DAPPUDRAFT_337183 [Daphnia pulex]|eukprot:EFX62272.1 hypothetical protein DAPPUDRAFT_337183 [Daphnia pulex]